MATDDRDPAAKFLEAHGEEFHQGNMMKVVQSCTEAAESASQITGEHTSRSGRINLKKVAEVLELEGLDLTTELIRVIKDGTLDPAVEAKVYLELLQYCQPKLKAVEITGKDGGDIKHSATFNVVFGSD